MRDSSVWHTVGAQGAERSWGLRLESWAGLRAGPDQVSVPISILWASASGAHLGHGAPSFPFPKGSSPSGPAPRSPPGLRLQLSFSGPGAAPAPCCGSRWRVQGTVGGRRGARAAPPPLRFPFLRRCFLSRTGPLCLPRRAGWPVVIFRRQVWESLPAGSPAGHGHAAHVMPGRYK